MLPPVVFAFVPGIGTVVSKRTAPSFPSRSIANASVASIAAAKMLTAVHNNVRFPGIASLPCFFIEPVLSGSRRSFSFFSGVSTKGLLKYFGIAGLALEQSKIIHNCVLPVAPQTLARDIRVGCGISTKKAPNEVRGLFDGA
jgi:hypothetical protein